MSKVIFKAYEWGTDKLRGCDWFGKPVTLTYKGDDTFRTLGGGMLSLSIFGFLVFYAVVLCKTMVERSDVKTTKNTIVKNLASDNTTHYPGRIGLAFAFDWLTEDNESLINETTFIDIKIIQVAQTLQPNGQYKREETELQYEPCGTKFPYDDQAQVKLFGLQDYLCLKTKDWPISGNYYSKNEKYIEIRGNRCTTPALCETPDDIKDKVKGSYIDLVMINSYFDFEDFNQPIKKYLDDRFTFNVISGFRSDGIIPITHNKAEAEDAFIQVGNPKEYEFYTVENFRQTFTSEDEETFVTLKFNLDAQTNVFQRTVFSFLDLTGQLGGINEVLIVFGSILTGFFTEKIFNYSVLSKLYQVDNSRDNKNDGNESVIEDKDNSPVKFNNNSLPIFNTIKNLHTVSKNYEKAYKYLQKLLNL